MMYMYFILRQDGSILSLRVYLRKNGIDWYFRLRVDSLHGW